MFMFRNIEHAGTEPTPDTHADPTVARSVFEDLDSFEHHEGPVTNVERELFVEHLLDSLRNAKDAEYCDNVADIYRGVHGPILVRREDPRSALHAVLQHESIELSYKKDLGLEEKTDTPYFNATRWQGASDVSGLRNPFIEGFSQAEGVVTVLGFEQGPQIEVVHPEYVAEKLQDSNIAHEKDVAVSGTLRHEDLLFMVTRMPTKFVPVEELSDDELDRYDEGRLPYIFRGVRLNKKEGGAPMEAPH